MLVSKEIATELGVSTKWGDPEAGLVDHMLASVISYSRIPVANHRLEMAPAPVVEPQVLGSLGSLALGDPATA
jgi:hypothetical protein